MLTQVIGFGCYDKLGTNFLGPIFVGEGQGKVYFLDIAKGEMFDFNPELNSIHGKI